MNLPLSLFKFDAYIPYWYADDPTTIHTVIRVNAINLVPGQLLPNSEDMLDGTEAVVKYLKTGLNGVVTTDNLKLNRITVKRLPITTLSPSVWSNRSGVLRRQPVQCHNKVTSF